MGTSLVSWGKGARRVVAGVLAGTALMGGIAATDAQEGSALIRVVHASPDAPAVDIYVDGEVAISDLAFGEATDLVPLPAGSYDVAVAPAGTSEDDAVIEATLDLESGGAYDVVAVGFLDEIGAEVFPVDLTATGEGQARVRVIHASPDAPAVDVALADGTALIEELAFPDDSGYLDVDAGSYDLQVLVSGTDTVALDLPGVAFEAGTVYDVYAVGSVEDGTLTVLPLGAPAAVGSAGQSGAGAAALPAAGVGSALGGGTSPLVASFAGAALIALIAATGFGFAGLRVRADR